MNNESRIPLEDEFKEIRKDHQDVSMRLVAVETTLQQLVKVVERGLDELKTVDIQILSLLNNKADKNEIQLLHDRITKYRDDMTDITLEVERLKTARRNDRYWTGLIGAGVSVIVVIIAAFIQRG